MSDKERTLPRGIVPVLQTPFASDGSVDMTSLDRLTENAISAGAAGFLAPVVASEVAFLSIEERKQILIHLSSRLRGRLPLVVGASADDPFECRGMAELATDLEANSCLIAVPQRLYDDVKGVVPFFSEAYRECELPLIIQDLQFGGPGLPLSVMRQLRERLPSLCGFKIETVPAGPKYSSVREAFGPEFYIAGGWAIPQMIEGMDRGVDAMIPESSMVRVYYAIHQYHQAGRREEAIKLFRALLPVLVFTNQDLGLSIAFFKRLLVRKGLFMGESIRIPGFEWDRYNSRIALELVDYYLQLESTVPLMSEHLSGMRFQETV